MNKHLLMAYAVIILMGIGTYMAALGFAFYFFLPFVFVAAILAEKLAGKADNYESIIKRKIR